jgi:Zn-dependent protease/CBS domain-containing protein
LPAIAARAEAPLALRRVDKSPFAVDSLGGGVVMKWSWKIGRLAGIDVHMHATFIMLLVWVGAAHYLRRGSMLDALAGLGLIAAVFASVVLHELGHALTARRFGIRTRDITLLPIGGVARLERMPDDPKQELWVALAGPAVNVALAAVMLVAAVPAATLASMLQVQLIGGALWAKLLWINVALAGFNLIPAFPMDGGRVLRALLAMRMDYLRATHAAALLGQAVALVFGLVGLFTNPFLVFIALFVWMGASAEASAVQLRQGMSGVPVWRLMMTEFRSLSPNESLERAVDHVLAGSEQDFPVVDGEELVGILTRAELLKALARPADHALVGEVMQRGFATADPSEMADVLMTRLQSCECDSLAVMRDKRLLGLVTMQSVAEHLMARRVVGAWPAVAAAGASPR